MRQKLVISASRRIDMAATCPETLLDVLARRFPPERTHTLVIWTKDPGRLLTDRRVRKRISAYPSLFVHATITGMGGSFLEPRVPPMARSLAALEDVVALVSGPLHVAVRFDPIVHFRFRDGTDYCNLHHFEEVARCAARLGISRVIVSWMQLYRKVERRLASAGVEAKALDSAGREAETEHLRRIATGLGLDLQGCCVVGWPRGACIDGARFQRIHPAGERCSQARAQGQRDLCGCTRSIDVGWYGPCIHGCLYCYANPKTYGSAVGGLRRPK